VDKDGMAAYLVPALTKSPKKATFTGHAFVATTEKKRRKRDNDAKKELHCITFAYALHKLHSTRPKSHGTSRGTRAAKYRLPSLRLPD
jgi:hypothetical protein